MAARHAAASRGRSRACGANRSRVVPVEAVQKGRERRVSMHVTMSLGRRIIAFVGAIAIVDVIACGGAGGAGETKTTVISLDGIPDGNSGVDLARRMRGRPGVVSARFDL